MLSLFSKQYFMRPCTKKYVCAKACLSSQQHESSEQRKVNNLVTLLDGYFKNDGFHLNVNTLTKEMLMNALEYPDKYRYNIRVSGYCVSTDKLSREQLLDIISRTFHEKI